MFEGLPERIKKEINILAPPTVEIKVNALPERKYGAWIGVYIFASLADFQRRIISHAEYNECGTGIVHRKCI